MINNVLVVGGTHGNELTGITVVKQWDNVTEHLTLSQCNFNIQSMLANSAAIQQRTRYVEEDLNRQFSIEKLAENSHAEADALCMEGQLAQKLNQQFGPKANPTYDLVIDFHNTTANLGPCLIILATSEFEVGMARFVKHVMPDAVILLENEKTYEEFPYLCTLGKHGVMIELGAQPHGVNDPDVFQSGLTLLKAITDYCNLYNESKLPELAPIEAFHLTGEVPYPDKSTSEYMLHPALFGNDFEELNAGDPCFITVDGNTVCWEHDTTYPHFVGEVAYQHLGMAFATSDKIKI